ncbi:hypothetical protein B9T19_07610 [Ignatzschineria sp. F8392]|uniref:hypothetical protein n=1 Tax=Ignatzschineria sp. F8392 TaxID=1980117 RepID=UPI000B999D8E|nr:hypothetical protein [Ignatzschineria sp. F8392]OYQ78705.1 hypothetical protein B9T19_07610 [Ignatzschineria sp. F8392]
MGFWSSIGSAISSAFSACCSVVSNAISGLSNFATKFGPAILGGLSKINPIINIVSALVGIFKPNENTEEMGDRAIQAGRAGIQMENYEKYEEYLQAIRDFDLDPDISISIPEEEKQLAGIGVACRGIEDKFDLPEGTGGALAVLSGLNPKYFNSDRIVNYLKSGEAKSFIDYFDKDKLQPAAAEKTVEKMITIEKEFGNTKSEDSIFDEIETVKDNLYRN